MSVTPIQSRSGTSNVEPQSLAFTSPVSLGSLLLVCVRESGGVANPTVTDTLGNSYAKLAGTGNIALYGARSLSAGACTVTADGSTNSNTRLTIHEFDGDWADTITVFSGPTYNAPGATSPQSTGSVSPTGDALLFAVMGTVSDVTWTSAGTGWTLGDQAAGNRRVVGAHRVVAAGTYSAEFAWTGAANGQEALILAIAETVQAPSRVTLSFTAAAGL